MATASSDPARPRVPPRPDGDRSNVHQHAPTDLGPSPSVASTDPSRKRPTAKQQQILIAYHDCGNAAAVARMMGVSERHVRRLVHEHASLLQEWRRERESEQIAAADARAARVRTWTDSSVGAALDRLRELVTSCDDRVALQAIRMTLDLVHRDSLGAGRPEPQPDTEFRTRSRNINDRLEAVALAAAEGDSDGDSNG